MKKKSQKAVENIVCLALKKKKKKTNLNDAESPISFLNRFKAY